MEGRPGRPAGPEPGGPRLCPGGGRGGGTEGGPGVPVSDPGEGLTRTCLPTRREGQFLERKAAIEAGLEEVGDFTFALELQSLTALAGTPTPLLALGGSLSQTVHHYPMSLLYRDGRWYLSAAPSDRRALLGREVTAVNGRSMEKTVDVFGAILSADNGVKLRRQYRQSCNVAGVFMSIWGWSKGGPGADSGRWRGAGTVSCPSGGAGPDRPGPA